MFRGVGTAIVTPFKNGEIDYLAYEKLVKFQLENEVDALIVLGTTGEAPTVNDTEREKLVSRTLELVNNRVPVIVGAGTNSTEKTVQLVKQSEKLVVDGVLIVTPYYNKPTQNGLYEHYKYISERTNLKIIVYNVPGRTGVSINPETMVRLVEDCQNIVGLKEAAPNMNQIDMMIKLTKAARRDFMVYSGNDDLAFHLMCSGGDGVISVASNIIPKEMVHMCRAVFSSNLSAASKIHHRYFELMKALFIETNPIPVKTALWLMGYIENEFRLPLVRATETTVKKLKDVLQECGLI
ncbi:MAG: 4-hydroxy-tetrahydrodipicolinate synthase [Thermotogaceae bacterium]|jgi:4-hydroxy-tetrahydrodipicolinate synthase|nr:4-hydroxy-tetrahydrodipicolinate synthase [Thermotogaceae bacterium]